MTRTRDQRGAQFALEGIERIIKEHGGLARLQDVTRKEGGEHDTMLVFADGHTSGPHSLSIQTILHFATRTVRDGGLNREEGILARNLLALRPGEHCDIGREEPRW